VKRPEAVFVDLGDPAVVVDEILMVGATSSALRAFAFVARCSTPVLVSLIVTGELVGI